MTRSPGSVLAGIPGWERASASELKGGLSNHTWLVEAHGRKAVLKFDPQPREAPFNSREAEARIQAEAAEQRLASRVLYVTDTVYLTEYLEGEVWTPRHFDDDAKLEQLALALRRLHSLPLTGRAFDALDAARGYAVRIDSALADQVGNCLQIIEATPRPQDYCCCHNDLVAENIVATPDLRFLDWEYACDNDPLFDLATVVAHHELPGERRDLLLDAYFEGDGDRWKVRLAEFERVYRALLWLWSAARGSERGVCRPK